MAVAVINKEFWCPRVRTYFDTFVQNPRSLQHLLLFGPPGSGKTTSAQWLVQQIWKQQKALMCISMNAADERSLEAIRQKIFPFLRASWTALELNPIKAPRFIILDECETLTEAAQLSLQTILDKDPSEVCVVLICNSQSRIHPKLRQRLLRIRYDPPNTQRGLNRSAFHEITRGDLRLLSKKGLMDQRLWFYINGHPATITQFLQDTEADTTTILSELLLLSNLMAVLDEELLKALNEIIPIMNASMTCLMGRLAHLIALFQHKFEESLKA
jgi:predicted AAA+ superfamily ATPase